MGVRRASSLGGCALKQHVVFIAQGMLITKQAEPRSPRNGVHPDGKLVAPQPKANHPINLRNAKRQAEEGIEWSIVRQGKPTVELAKSSPLGGTCARADSTTLPALARASAMDVHDGGDIELNHAAAVYVKGVAQAGQLPLQGLSPILHVVRDGIIPIRKGDGTLQGALRRGGQGVPEATRTTQPDGLRGTHSQLPKHNLPMHSLRKSKQAPPQLNMGLTKTLAFLFAGAGQPSNTPELASIRPSRRIALLKHGTHESQRYPIMQDTKLLLQLHPCPIEAAAQACESGGKT